MRNWEYSNGNLSTSGTSSTSGSDTIMLEIYKKAQEEGRLIILPCPIGSKIHRIVTKKSSRGKEYSYITTGSFSFGDIDKLGATIFLSRSEAIKHLMEK